MRLNGFVHRKTLEYFVESLVEVLTGDRILIKAVLPVINKTVSLYDYILSLSIAPQNLLVNYSHHTDIVAEIARG